METIALSVLSSAIFELIKKGYKKGREVFPQKLKEKLPDWMIPDETAKQIENLLPEIPEEQVKDEQSLEHYFQNQAPWKSVQAKIHKVVVDKSRKTEVSGDGVSIGISGDSAQVTIGDITITPQAKPQPEAKPTKKS